MTEVGVLFRDEVFLFDVFTMDDAFCDELKAKLERIGGRLLKFRPWEVTLGFCPGQKITIRQVHTTDAEQNLWHADGRPFNYLDVEVTEPCFGDAYGGILGQTYQCKYVLDGEPFVWSPEQEEAFRLEGDISTPNGVFEDDATCGATSKRGAARQEFKQTLDSLVGTARKTEVTAMAQ
jgi:hypothetical protein